MSKLSNVPVTTCKRCGKTLFLTHHETMQSDPSGDNLMKLTRMLLENAICKDCQRAEHHYASTGQPDPMRRIRHG